MSKKLKICFFTKNIFCLGGVERVVSVLANSFIEEFEVEIVCFHNTYKVDRSIYNLDSRIEVKIIDFIFKKNIFTKIFSKIVRKFNENTNYINNSIFTNILTEAYYPKEIQERLIKYINSRDYDLIIGVEGEYSLLLGIINDKIKPKAIGWQHNSYKAYFDTKGKYHWKQDLMFKKYINSLDNYVVLTESDKIEMNTHLGINSKRIYNPLSFTSSYKSTCQNKSIISVGRLVKEQKGFDLLIEAFSKVAFEDNEWILKIVGDGEDKDEIQKLIDSYKLSKRVIIEPFTNEIMKEYLKSSIFISSSRWEGFGLVITEAMECGLPVIAFDNSGPKEIINLDGVNGILVPKYNIDLLAEAMIDLIKDNKKRLKIANESILRSEDFSIKRITDEWKSIIN